MRAFSLMETIRIRQRGYIHRIPFAEFIRRYHVNPLRFQYFLSHYKTIDTNFWHSIMMRQWILQLRAAGFCSFASNWMDGWYHILKYS